MTDIPNMTDREILIGQGTVLDKLCGSIKDLRDNNYHEHEKISEKIDSVVIRKISNRLFYSSASVIVAVLIIICSAIGLINIKVSGHDTSIEHIEHKINRMHP